MSHLVMDQRSNPNRTAVPKQPASRQRVPLVESDHIITRNSPSGASVYSISNWLDEQLRNPLAARTRLCGTRISRSAAVSATTPPTGSDVIAGLSSRSMRKDLNAELIRLDRGTVDFEPAVESTSPRAQMPSIQVVHSTSHLGRTCPPQTCSRP
jgi:hypothetical protein